MGTDSEWIAQRTAAAREKTGVPVPDKAVARMMDLLGGVLQEKGLTVLARKELAKEFIDLLPGNEGIGTE